MSPRIYPISWNRDDVAAAREDPNRATHQWSLPCLSGSTLFFRVSPSPLQIPPPLELCSARLAGSLPCAHLAARALPPPMHSEPVVLLRRRGSSRRRSHSMRPWKLQYPTAAPGRISFVGGAQGASHRPRRSGSLRRRRRRSANLSADGGPAGLPFFRQCLHHPMRPRFSHAARVRWRVPTHDMTHRAIAPPPRPCVPSPRPGPGDVSSSGRLWSLVLPRCGVRPAHAAAGDALRAEMCVLF